MDNKQVLGTLKLAREHSKKRNFSQSVDLIINLKGINIKKPDENINTFILLPHSKGKESKIAALVGKELINQAKSAVDIAIEHDEFPKFQQDSKKLKKIARDIDYFIAQANLMPDIAKYFGKVLGPMGKMPNPKTGSIVPPTIPDLKPIIEKFKRTIKAQTKNEPVIKCIVGTESMKDEDIAENIINVYNTVIPFLKDEKRNIKNVIIKFSMGKPLIVGKQYGPEELKEVQKRKSKYKEKLKEKSKW